ncbi:MAG: hypothetical protein E6J85_21605 [Deltaproteobacteria bacterium]|nr:MAG: hypothetical protein E6J85_21605 [Deltaproteobacteria bacterium]
MSPWTSWKAVPVRVASALSLAVKVCRPMVLKVTLTDAWPPSVPVSVTLGGSDAAGSELENAIVPL